MIVIDCIIIKNVNLFDIDKNSLLILIIVLLIVLSSLSSSLTITISILLGVPIINYIKHTNISIRSLLITNNNSNITITVTDVLSNSA